MNPNNLYEKCEALSARYCEAKRDAELAEGELKQLHAKLFLIYRAESKNIDETKARVETDESYIKARIFATEQKYKAELAKRAREDVETWFECWRTLQANERFVTRTAP